jgi:DNA invertase Pin-like site-specific DNA recombinase
MPRYGYARVSTLDQDLTIQQAALKAAGCDVIRAEKASGTRRDGRSELQVLLDFVRAGDTLVVTRIDRLARSLKDLQDIVHELKAKGVALKATEQPVDTGTASAGFTHQTALIAEPARQPRASVWKWALMSAPMRLRGCRILHDDQPLISDA